MSDELDKKNLTGRFIQRIRWMRVIPLVVIFLITLAIMLLAPKLGLAWGQSEVYGSRFSYGNYAGIPGSGLVRSVPNMSMKVEENRSLTYSAEELSNLSRGNQSVIRAEVPRYEKKGLQRNVTSGYRANWWLQTQQPTFRGDFNPAMTYESSVQYRAPNSVVFNHTPYRSPQKQDSSYLDSQKKLLELVKAQKQVRYQDALRSVENYDQCGYC